jgi:serine/threonine-protein kinase
VDEDRWTLLSEYFETALSMPRESRAAFIERVCADDEELRRELESLLRADDSSGAFLERPPGTGAEPAAAGEPLPIGGLLGHWRVLRLIGRGGMGEVYDAERATGDFEQRAAVKLTRCESAAQLERFNAERQLLARFDHPGIAHLLDGGVAPDGRPYFVMEYIDGRPITEHCDAIKAGLTQRLALFVQVCEAVAYAHRHLIVHRDIKPGNVLVDGEGRARLLDFGIAKPLDLGIGAAGDSTGMTTALLTPDYAAPEQLAGEPVTTATDVYALGVLLFELLTGRRPWAIEGQPFARALHTLLERPAPLASQVAVETNKRPVAPRQLQGDMDAIIAKCLRREPPHRYATVNALKLDIDCALRADPVAAREDARLYVFGRFLRRYRWAVASVAAIILILSVGIAATAWQAERASHEAKRAAATRDFLISVFRESDPQIARDRPPGAITAKELLDQSVDRIVKEFAADPDTQLQLLGVASEIYGYWLDEPRFMALLEQRGALARKHYGPTHPVVIESLTTNAWGSIYSQDYEEAQRLLDEADQLIREGGHDDSLLRAQWWLAKAEALKSADPAARVDALDRAIDLYARLAPEDAYYAIALANSAGAHFVREDYALAKERNQQAVGVFMAAKNRSDGDLAMTYANLARSLQQLGQFGDAERAYEQFAALTRRTFGERHGSYWQGAADHARMVHLRGERDRAHRMFDALFKVIPADWKETTDDVIAREYYAERLAAEGRAAEAIPWLEAAERSYVERPMREHDLRRVRQTLGDAYDRVGRHDDARRALAAAREERMAKDAPDSIAVLSVRERWARFLLTQGEIEAALAELRDIARIGRGRAIFPLALAYADLAQAAIARRDGATALAESRAALAMLDRNTGLYDVRIGPMLWRTHAEALALNGDAQGASDWNARALEASRRYDDPSSPSITLAASSDR